MSFSHAHILCLCIFYCYRPCSLYIQIVRVLRNRIPAVSSLWDSGPSVSGRLSSHTACIKVVGRCPARGWITPISPLDREPCPKSPLPLRTKPNPPPYPLPRNLARNPDKTSCPGRKLSCPHHKSGTRTIQLNESS